MRKLVFVLMAALLLIIPAAISVMASAPKVTVTAKKTSGDPATPGDAFWSTVTGQTIVTNSNPIIGGHGGPNDLPDVGVKAAYNNENLYMFFEWEDPTYMTLARLYRLPVRKLNISLG